MTTLASGEEALPVFGHEDEARMFSTRDIGPLASHGDDGGAYLGPS